MKKILSLSGFLFLSIIIFAQSTIQKKKLVATRQSRVVTITEGKKYLVKYQEAGEKKKTKLFFIGFSGDSILLTSRNGKKEQVVPVSSIQSMKRVNSSFRIIVGSIGVAGVAGGAAILENGGKGGTGWNTILAIPLVGIATYAIVAVPVSLLLDKLGEKRVNEGWSFRIQ
jgi:hypothetical protein